ncbi:PQQ-binding-like beta-propeller repeat protein [Protaetiibacter sp. SSC-01]|uniref:outer membrane protein assembly factor BamB family protein n=1 Tax=Protaetiibacter sp. SSC-01 TaxID=2759943 RepID=UPI00165705B4|nr:PQQ-binding-like beta-propeller repeat protein [Protaetiibacter sp. SSC-01]QNO37665.1 PQQ-binding-like beta-propeller repeat protein [Protaetiibacter sp. SSC-01]
MSDTTTVAAEPSEQPAALTPVSPLRRALVWAATFAVVAVGTLGLAASDLAPAPANGGRAARFVPADGSAMMWTASDGTRSIHENARDTGPAMLLELPANAAYGIFSDTPEHALRSIDLWRETTAFLDDPESSAVTSLYVLDDAGLSLLTATGGTVGFAYSPALVMLPADARPGVTWEGEGDAMPAGLLHYTTRGELTDAGDGCLVSTTDTRYLDPDSGAELLAVDEQATWCPGRGIVRDVGVVGGEEISYDIVELPETGGLGRTDIATTPARYDWTDADRWRPRDLEFVITDPGFGESPQGTPFDGLAATTSDGALVAAVGGRLASYTVEGGRATRGWLASPGGDLITLSAVGDVTLVTTATRRLVAYDERGARLWSTTFPDVVLAAPAVAPDDDIVAVSVDGTLRRIDLVTGETVWSTALRTDVDSTPAVGSGLAVVVDRGGAVIARSLADGTSQWSTDLVGAERAVAGEGVIAVQGVNADVWVLDPADGSTRWDADRRGLGRSIAIADGVVVALGDAGTAAWDVDDGRELWTSPADTQLLVGDGRLVLVTATSVEVRDPDGELVREVELGEAFIGVTRVVLPTPHGIRILNSNTTGTEVRG